MTILFQKIEFIYHYFFLSFIILSLLVSFIGALINRPFLFFSWIFLIFLFGLPLLIYDLIYFIKFLIHKCKEGVKSSLQGEESDTLIDKDVKNEVKISWIKYLPIFIAISILSIFFIISLILIITIVELTTFFFMFLFFISMIVWICMKIHLKRTYTDSNDLSLPSIILLSIYWCLYSIIILSSIINLTDKFSYKYYGNPPGNIYDINGYKRHLLCTGNGSTTVILEHGFHGASFEWGHVQKEISKHTKVCSYDRSG